MLERVHRYGEPVARVQPPGSPRVRRRPLAQLDFAGLFNVFDIDHGDAPRALLALAHLYGKVDMNRGVEELGNAVRTINTLESPDFSRQFVMMKIEGKTFGSYAAYSTPGFNPENAFREIAKLDLDGSLAQATTFTDKSLRSLTTLAVIEPCFGCGA